MSISQGFVKGLKCRECGKEYPKEPIYVCEFCFGSLEVSYDYAGIQKVVSRKSIEAGPASLWRYRPLLPIDGEPAAGHHSGFTPLVRAKNLAKRLGLKELYIKDDSVSHPTFSFKDRVVSIAISKAKEFGFKTVACASTGNLANSVSAQSASCEMECYLFIPADLELGKVVGSLVFAPNLVAVRGNYDEVNRLCSEIASKYKWAFVNINIRPFYAEGSKTLAYEIMEQLGWRTPDHIVSPAAGGSLITKICKAIHEFEDLKLVPKSHTKVHCAQPSGCGPIATMIRDKSDVMRPVKQPRTIAKSLAIGNPADGYYASDAVRKSGGTAELATDEEIVEGIKLLASTEGIFTETAGGVTVACAKKLIEAGHIGKNESVVLAITGNGLKTQEAVQNAIGRAVEIDPTLASFESCVNVENISSAKSR
jgi:threonine synthase